MFVDASAIVAILLREKERDEFLRRIEGAPETCTSIVALFEAVLGTATRFRVADAGTAVEEFVATAGIKVLPADSDLLPALTDAHGRYGKGSGHPAKLNMGDCYSYALAKRTNGNLLYKGDDFARTDLA